MFINVSLPEIYYSMKWIGDLDMKNNIFLDTVTIVFCFDFLKKKPVIDELNQ